MHDGAAATSRQKVYEYICAQIQDQKLTANAFLDLKHIGKTLGLSRTPMRDAIFKLESEGFVTVYPRRGVRVNALNLKDYRDLYEMIGALESAALLSVSVRLTDAHIRRMDELNGEMAADLEKRDYDTYIERNRHFHGVFLELSENGELLRTVANCKARIRNSPKRERLMEWELASLGEHRQIVRFLENGDFNAAAELLRDVHWSFTVQERHIRKFYCIQKSGAPTVSA